MNMPQDLVTIQVPTNLYNELVRELSQLDNGEAPYSTRHLFTRLLVLVKSATPTT